MALDSFFSFHPFKKLKKFLPKTLLGRSLIILIAPVLLIQGVMTYVFLDRHLAKVTDLLAQNISGSMAAFLELTAQKDPVSQTNSLNNLKPLFREHFHLEVSFSDSPSSLKSKRVYGFLEEYLSTHLQRKISYPYKVIVSDPYSYVFIETPQNSVRFSFKTKRLFSKTTEILLWWALGTPILFLFIAILFLRNQVRPLRHLSEGVEAFGKGQEKEELHPSGAREIRKVTEAFNAMQARIRRQIEQRTHMLAGVSHDLRTPLARMSLQLAIMPESEDTKALQEDLKEMETMLASYLAFARGEAAESPQEISLHAFMRDLVRGIHEGLEAVSLPKKDLLFKGRHNALKRCVANLIQNGLRYAPAVWIKASFTKEELHIVVDDNGPGIPKKQRENVFKPFMRLEESRNTETGGTGLGLSIARDIARSHGGEITLKSSPKGGLRATLSIPL